ncbi:MAG: TetR/AcrR family transcriptional regulator, partial [Chryseobacterium sp.]|nr:TetR/AcrR family transcriptional regulator [Chryseobacterium sp.]
AKERLLNTYFIFFENLTMNRSLVLMLLGKEKIQGIKVLQNLRETHRQFMKTLDFNTWEILEKAKENIRNFNEKSRQEVLWLHLVSCIEFWKKDTSPDFEKTDLFIEKTVDTGFELIDNEPLRKMVDLGKFLWKEKFKIR